MVHAHGVDAAGTQNAAQRELRADAVAVRPHMSEHGDAFPVELFQQRREARTFFFEIFRHDFRLFLQRFFPGRFPGGTMRAFPRVCAVGAPPTVSLCCAMKNERSCLGFPTKSNFTGTPPSSKAA